MDKLEEFQSLVDKIYGVYMDSTEGFHLVRRKTIASEEQAQEYITKALISRPEYAHYTLAPSDEMTHWYSRPGKERHKGRSPHLHRCTLAKLKARNQPQGDNFRFVANMCLVTIYQYWDDYYRGTLAEALGCSPDSIKVPVFGDLRRLRRSIIHNRGIAIPEVRRCEVFRWFQPGEEIFLDRDRFEEILDAVLECIAQLRDNPWQFVRTT